MSDFLKFAYEMIATIIYNLTSWAVAIFQGFVRVFITGWADYVTILRAHFPYFNIVLKILAILLCVLLLSIPAGLLYLLISRIILRIRIRATKEDSATLYREIGKLNRQVLDLMDEKNKILALKVHAVSGSSGDVGYVGTGALIDEGEAPVGKTAVLESAAAESMPLPGGTAYAGPGGVPVAGAPIAGAPIDPLAQPIAGGRPIEAIATGGSLIGEEAIS
ncbi:MAG: hypothetical protein IKN53_01310, partial [Oscillibacter sp.]|nr:hypothetical protein [Oscillibacter sp.]